MKNTIRRSILGIQSRSISGDYLVEIRLRQWMNSGDDMKLLYVYAISSPAESILFYGISETAQWDNLLAAREAGMDVSVKDCLESFDTMDGAEVSSYGNFYHMAENILSDMKQVFEEDLPSEEDEEKIDFSEFDIPEDTEVLYRMRLSLETDISLNSIFHDSNKSEFEYEKKYVRALIASCESESDYVVWKKNFIEFYFPKTKMRDIVVCTYIFNGFGRYEMILPQEELHPFQGWLSTSGAMDAGMREASDDEIRTYVAMQAARM